MTLTSQLNAVKEALEKLPDVREFHINPIGGENIKAEGNDWFCHSHEVKAYIAAVKSAKALFSAIIEQAEAMQSSRAWDNQISAQVQETLTWAHNVGMFCDKLPEDNKAKIPIEVFYLRHLKNAVDKLEKARSDRMLSVLKSRADKQEAE